MSSLSMRLPRLRLAKATFLWSLLLVLGVAEAQNLTDGQIDVISARLAESALERWVIHLSTSLYC